MADETPRPASTSKGPESQHNTNITIIGAGTIGLSFTALHLIKNPTANLTIFDTRPDLQDYIDATLHTYLTSPKNDSSSFSTSSSYTARLTLASTLKTAVQNADIIQEQGPENPTWKQETWSEIEQHAPKSALFWSSTSGIPASLQSAKMSDKSRLLVVHPYNPPHIMPLLEIVPAPTTSQDDLNRTVSYWEKLGRTPVVLKKECTGFVANRLAFALLREAFSLVREGVIGVEELDDLVTASMGPRWAVQGPFKSYHAGGGEDGLKGFMQKIGGTVRDCWTASEEVKVGPGDSRGEEAWEDQICDEAERVYGKVDTAKTSELTRSVLDVTRNDK